MKLGILKADSFSVIHHWETPYSALQSGFLSFFSLHFFSQYSKIYTCTAFLVCTSNLVLFNRLWVVNTFGYSVTVFKENEVMFVEQ